MTKRTWTQYGPWPQEQVCGPMMTLYLWLGESPPTVKELGPGWCSRYSLALRVRRTRARRASSLMGGPRDPGEAPRPLGDVPRGEGGRRDPGEGGRAPLPPVGEGGLRAPGEGGRVLALLLLLRGVGVGEGGVRAAGLMGEVRGEVGVEGGRAEGEAPRFWRGLSPPPPSDTLGEGFLRAAPLPLLVEGDRWRRTRGEVGGVARLAGGEGVARVDWPRLATPPTLLPRPT